MFSNLKLDGIYSIIKYSISLALLKIQLKQKFQRGFTRFLHKRCVKYPRLIFELLMRWISHNYNGEWS